MRTLRAAHETDEPGVAARGHASSLGPGGAIALRLEEGVSWRPRGGFYRPRRLGDQFHAASGATAGHSGEHLGVHGTGVNRRVSFSAGVSRALVLAFFGNRERRGAITLGGI